MAVSLALARLRRSGALAADPLVRQIAAVSVGVIDGEPRLDLPYDEDSRAEVDFNVVMTAAGEYVEVQGTAEHGPFTRDAMDELLRLAAAGIDELLALQRAAVAAGSG